MKNRQVIEQTLARPSSDGEGVKLLRVFGGRAPERFDPFILLDEFGSDKPDDYIGGFPPHPHRGFSTITYMLEGKMEHKDHLGNVGLLTDGGVQWMTAGKGVIHSEMPKQTEGKMRGFQLWLNLPAADKMQPAHYEDVPPEAFPLHAFEGVQVKAIAGKAHVDDHAVEGYFQVPTTEPVYLDIHLDGNASTTVLIGESHQALAYVYEGEVELGAKRTHSPRSVINRFGSGEAITINNPQSEPARLIVLAGVPLKEPIAQYGPFVMNDMAEIDQAVRDYRAGTLVE